MRRALAAVAALTLAFVGSPLKARAADPFIYVSLGDSYVSGPLVMPHDQRWVPQDCGQSMRNFAHLAALDIKPDIFRDVSCGSATIKDFTRPQNAFVNGVAAPQFDALSKRVDVVTVGISGNDVGFVSLALDCMRFTPPPTSDPPCTPKYKHNGIDEIRIASPPPHPASARPSIRFISGRHTRRCSWSATRLHYPTTPRRVTRTFRSCRTTCRISSPSSKK